MWRPRARHHPKIWSCSGMSAQTARMAGAQSATCLPWCQSSCASRQAVLGSQRASRGNRGQIHALCPPNNPVLACEGSLQLTLPRQQRSKVADKESCWCAVLHCLQGVCRSGQHGVGITITGRMDDVMLGRAGHARAVGNAVPVGVCANDELEAQTIALEPDVQALVRPQV